MIDLLKKNGPFFKANLHCHTTLSDGKMTAQQVKDWYKSHGYSIVAFTDHSVFRTYPELQDEDFVAVAGVESAWNCLDMYPNTPPLKYKTCHINFWAKDPETAVYIPEEPTYDVGVINRYIANMKKNGWLCGLNHPGWSLQTTEEIHGIHGLTTFEVYNNAASSRHNNGDGHTHYALYLNSGNHAYAVAADDNHIGFDPDGRISEEDDTCGGWINISMPKLSYANFFDALENGRFYATTGPEIHELYIDEERDVLVVSCSPAKLVLIKGIHTRQVDRILKREDSITHAEFPLSQIRKKEPFIRLEIMDSNGKCAYSQPYYFA